MLTGLRNGPPTAVALAVAIISTAADAAVWQIESDGSMSDVECVAVFSRLPGRAIDTRISSRAPGVPTSLRPAFSAAAAKQDLSRHLVEAVAWAESRYQEGARSSAGAYGVMQLMKGTADDLGVDRFRTEDNIAGGATYLRRLLNRYQGDIAKALAAYNAGPVAVDRYHGIPPFPETQRYVARILKHLALLSVKSEIEP